MRTNTGEMMRAGRERGLRGLLRVIVWLLCLMNYLQG